MAKRFKDWQMCITALSLHSHTQREYYGALHECHVHDIKSSCDAIQPESDFMERVRRLSQRVDEYCPFMNDVIGTGAMLSKEGDL